MNRTIKRAKSIPKGDRMGWDPIGAEKPVRITDEMAAGKRLSDEDLLKYANRQINHRIP